MGKAAAQYAAIFGAALAVGIGYMRYSTKPAAPKYATWRPPGSEGLESPALDSSNCICQAASGAPVCPWSGPNGGTCPVDPSCPLATSGGDGDQGRSVRACTPDMLTEVTGVEGDIAMAHLATNLIPALSIEPYRRKSAVPQIPDPSLVLPEDKANKLSTLLSDVAALCAPAVYRAIQGDDWAREGSLAAPYFAEVFTAGRPDREDVDLTLMITKHLARRVGENVSSAHDMQLLRTLYRDSLRSQVREIPLRQLALPTGRSLPKITNVSQTHLRLIREGIAFTELIIYLRYCYFREYVALLDAEILDTAPAARTQNRLSSVDKVMISLFILAVSAASYVWILKPLYSKYLATKRKMAIHQKRKEKVKLTKEQEELVASTMPRKKERKQKREPPKSQPQIVEAEAGDQVQSSTDAVQPRLNRKKEKKNAPKTVMRIPYSSQEAAAVDPNGQVEDWDEGLGAWVMKSRAQKALDDVRRAKERSTKKEAHPAVDRKRSKKERKSKNISSSDGTHDVNSGTKVRASPPTVTKPELVQAQDSRDKSSGDKAITRVVNEPEASEVSDDTTASHLTTNAASPSQIKEDSDTAAVAAPTEKQNLLSQTTVNQEQGDSSFPLGHRDDTDGQGEKVRRKVDSLPAAATGAGSNDRKSSNNTPSADTPLGTETEGSLSVIQGTNVTLAVESVVTPPAEKSAVLSKGKASEVLAPTKLAAAEQESQQNTTVATKDVTQPSRGKKKKDKKSRNARDVRVRPSSERDTANEKSSGIRGDIEASVSESQAVERNPEQAGHTYQENESVQQPELKQVSASAPSLVSPQALSPTLDGAQPHGIQMMNVAPSYPHSFHAGTELQQNVVFINSAPGLPMAPQGVPIMQAPPPGPTPMHYSQQPQYFVNQRGEQYPMMAPQSFLHGQPYIQNQQMHVGPDGTMYIAGHPQPFAYQQAPMGYMSPPHGQMPHGVSLPQRTSPSRSPE